MGLREFFTLIERTFVEWLDDNGPRLGAALSFYSVFSLAPLLVIVVWLTSIFFGREAVQGRVVQQVEVFIGREPAELVQSMIKSGRSPGTGIFATVTSTVALLLGASGVFNELQKALNAIWNVPAKRLQTFSQFMKDRLLSFAMVIATGLVLLASLFSSAVLQVLTTAQSRFEVPSATVQLLQSSVWFVGTVLGFAIIFKLLPDAEVKWRDVWLGAGLTAVLFSVGKTLIALYVGRSTVASIYGAAGSLAMILFWVYYSAQILLFGAEFTQVYSQRRNEPAPLVSESTETTR